jgi:hypothetical protein
MIAMRIEAGTMSKVVYLTEILKSLLSSSESGFTLEKAGKRTLKGKTSMVMADASFVATLSFLFQCLRRRKLKLWSCTDLTGGQ